VGDVERRLEFLVKPPCLLFEDDHLLVINKPAGLNTHSPGPFAGEGLYDWLRHREPRWASLAIIHRLDKETSGLIVFSKSSLANRSLTDQFTRRLVRKKYLLLTDHKAPGKDLWVKTALVRAGDRYVSRPVAVGADIAETHFSTSSQDAGYGLGSSTLVEAEPRTGRSHQIRVHAAEKGFPILGDVRYGGSPAPRVCLHAAELIFRHPATGQDISFFAPADFAADPALLLRSSLINPQSNTALRLINGASDGWTGWYVDRLGDYLLSQSAGPATPAQKAKLSALADSQSLKGVYHKLLSSTPRNASRDKDSMELGIRVCGAKPVQRSGKRSSI
jgi:RluA family pseudouridine synthase